MMKAIKTLMMELVMREIESIIITQHLAVMVMLLVMMISIK